MKLLIIFTAVGLVLLITCLLIDTFLVPPHWFSIIAENINKITLVLYLITVFISIKKGYWDEI